jgi:fucose permease
MLGPLLPALIFRWHIQDAQAGTLFTASFLGQLVGAWFGTYNLRFSLIGGAALSSIGAAALAWTGFHGAHVALFAAGLGLSAGLTAGNVVVGTSSRRGAHDLALFNASWSIGAIASSLLARLCGLSRVHLFFLIAAILAAVGGFLVASLPRSLTQRPSYLDRCSHRAGSTFLPLPTLTLFAITMLVYVGNEHSLGGWLPSFALRTNPAIHASTIALLYWSSELVGRLLMVSLFRDVPETLLYRLSLVVLVMTQIGLILIPHPRSAFIYTATVLSGATMAPLYPLIVTFLLTRTGNHPWLGRLFSSCSLGGASLPWLTGTVSTHFGGLRIGLLVPLVGAILMLSVSREISPPEAITREKSDARP